MLARLGKDQRRNGSAMGFVEELKRRNVFRVGVAYGVTSWVILQLADIVFDNVPAPEWVMQALMVILLIGLLVTLIVAWAFELTPEGIKKEKDVDRSQSGTHSTGRRLDRAIIAILVLAVVLLVADRMYFSRQANQVEFVSQSEIASEPASPIDNGASVAVLPFLNLSNNEDNEYFSDGLTETLLHMLAQIQELRVAARTSAFAFKGQNKDIREIAFTLGVAHVLEGSVQRSGEQIRVTAQLIRAEDGFQVWSQNYDRTLDDIFAIQDEIASDVASALGASLLPGQTTIVQGVATTDTDAYDNYLRALEKYAVFSYASLSEGENLLKAALSRDPDFFEARIALVRNYQKQVNTGLIERDPGNDRIDALVTQLLAERPDDPAARSLDLIQQGNKKIRNGDFVGIQALLPKIKEILAIAPNETGVRQSAAGILQRFDQNEEALELLSSGLLIDPLDPDLHRAMAGVYQRLERFDEAEKSLIKAQELNPDDPNIVGALAGLSARQDQVVEMLTWYRRSAEMDPQDHEIPAIIARTLFRFNFFESGDFWASRTRALAPNSPAYRGLELARALAIGDDEKTKAIALKIIADEVPDRNGVATTAKNTYAQIMQLQGQSQQAVDQLETILPGVSEDIQIEDDLPVMISKAILMPMHKELSSPQDFRKRYEQMVRVADAKALPWRTDAQSLLLFSLLGDDMETALSAAIESLDEYSTMNYGWKRFATAPIAMPLLDEPEVMSRIAHFKSEEARLHDELEDMLLEPEWAL